MIWNQEDAIKYIREKSKPYGLEYECLEVFKAYCRASRAHGNEEVDYEREAKDALWEWDIE